MTLRRALVWIVAVTSGLGLAVELWHGLAPSAVSEALVPELSLSGEGNVPTWATSMLLFCSAIAAGSIAARLGRPGVAVLATGKDDSAVQRIASLLTRSTDPFRRAWWGVAFVFGYASLDEVAQLHEHLGGHLALHGILFYDWIIPAALVVALLAIVFWPFMRALRPATRRGLVVAGAIYLGGAIGMELPLGWWTDHHGIESLGYGLIDWVEETLELIGASLALLAITAHLGELE